MKDKKLHSHFIRYSKSTLQNSAPIHDKDSQQIRYRGMLVSFAYNKILKTISLWRENVILTHSSGHSSWILGSTGFEHLARMGHQWEYMIESTVNISSQEGERGFEMGTKSSLGLFSQWPKVHSTSQKQHLGT
jgi:hypothetical protein